MKTTSQKKILATEHQPFEWRAAKDLHMDLCILTK